LAVLRLIFATSPDSLSSLSLIWTDDNLTLIFWRVPQIVLTPPSCCDDLSILPSRYYHGADIECLPGIMIRRNTIDAVLELGAGCALPSLLLSTLSPPSKVPKIIVITDYPDETILRNLRANVERNTNLIQAVGCEVTWKGYEWGTDPEEVL
jgi:hypothetical protein